MFKLKLNLLIEFLLFLAIITFLLVVSLAVSTKINEKTVAKDSANINYCNSGDSCCLSSLQRIKTGGYQVMDSACPVGFTKNALRCSSSLSWCEPVVDEKNKKKALASSGSESDVVAKGIANEVFGDNESWKTFNYNVLGLSFQYPESWGEPYTEPSKNITDLEQIFEKYKGKSNGYEQALNIDFPNSSIRIKLLNDRSKSNDKVDVLLGNVKNLNNVEDICKVNLVANAHVNYLKCEDNVLHVLSWIPTKNIYYKYQYFLKNYGLKKLQTDFYNIALILDKSAFLGSLYGTSTQDLSVDDMLAATKTSRKEYERNKNIFTKFVNSMEVVAPLKAEPKLNNISSSDNKDIRTIKTYYNFIMQGDLRKAYDMQTIKKVNFEEFNSWYKQAISAIVVDIVDLGNGEYKFMLNYLENNVPLQRYRVVMKVKGENIETISSEEITSDVISFGKTKAFTKNKSGFNYVVLAIDGQEVVIDKAPDDFTKDIATLNFKNLMFSSQGNYLMYNAYGWEWGSAKVYDIQASKFVNKEHFPGTPVIGISKNEKYLYACAASDMGGIYYAKVYSLPTAEIVFDAMNGHTAYLEYPHCEYDAKESILTINIKCSSLPEDQECQESVRKFDLETGKEIVK